MMFLRRDEKMIDFMNSHVESFGHMWNADTGRRNFTNLFGVLIFCACLVTSRGLAESWSFTVRLLFFSPWSGASKSAWWISCC